MRQKVVSILIFLGVVFSIFRCSGGEKDESVHEVALSAEEEAEAIHQKQAEIGRLAREEGGKVDSGHAVEVVEHVVHEEEKVAQALKPSHEKTLFFKSDDFIQNQKIEKERMASLASAAEAKEAVHAKARAEAAKEKARLEKELAAKIEADKAATIKAEADKKLQKESEILRLSEENAKMKSSQQALLGKIKEWEVKADTAEKDSLKVKADAKEQLLAKIKEWEVKANESEAESTKLKVATAAAAALATQQAVANAKSHGDEEVAKLQSALDKLTEEKRALEESNSEIKSSQELLLAKIEDWEVRATASEEESAKLKAEAESASKEALASSKKASEDEIEKLQSALDKLTEEKAALQSQIEVFQQANVDMNSSINTTKKSLLVKIEEWEKKALAAKSEEKSTFAKTVEKYKGVLANLTQEKIALEEANAKMKSSQQALLEKLESWEAKATEAEAQSGKLKMAAAAAATLATQQAVANAQSIGEEEATKLRGEIAQLTEEKSSLLQANADMNSSIHATEEELLAKIAHWETKATAAEEESAKANAALTAEKERLLQANADMNSSMHATEEGLLAKIAEWEIKATESEENSKKLKAAAAAAALLATQQATAEKEAAGEVEAKLKEVEAKLAQMKEDAANLAAKEAEEKAKEEAEARAKEEAARAEVERVAKEKIAAKKAAKEKLESVLASSQVEFKYNSSQLTKKSEELLNTVFEIINEHPSFSYDIQGHTDAHGNEDYNVKLSTSRAEKVKAYLVEKGIDANNLTAKGFGSSMPIADNSTNEGRLQNRRVVIKIVE